MVHLVVLCKLQTHVTQEKLEEMARQARTQLLKIPEALQVRAGKRIENDNTYPYFYSVDVESLEKLAMYRDDPNQVKFVEEVIKPNTRDRLEMVYELEPNKDVRYS
jgi:hypothetical protein